MLKQIPFANSAALVSVLLYLALWLLDSLVPRLFTTIFNAQFLGANVASLYTKPDVQTMVIIIVIVAAFSWVWGYVFVWFYNKLSK